MFAQAPEKRGMGAWKELLGGPTSGQEHARLRGLGAIQTNFAKRWQRSSFGLVSSNVLERHAVGQRKKSFVSTEELLGCWPKLLGHLSLFVSGFAEALHDLPPIILPFRTIEGKKCPYICADGCLPNVETLSHLHVSSA